jgi:HSP20 family protein
MSNKSWLPPWGERTRDVEHFRSFKTQVDSLFEDWLGRSMGGTLAPRVDIAEDKGMITVTAELPGVSENDIDIALRDDQLTIKGEKRSEHEEKREGETHVLHRTERSYGAFQRTLTLPYRVEPEQITAHFKDGVLRVTIPKPADAQAQKEGRKIEINRPPSTGGGFTTA